MERLKREREESNQKKEPPKEYAQSIVFENSNGYSTKSKHKKFDDVDFSSKEFEVEKVKKKRKTSVHDEDAFEADTAQHFKDVEYKTENFEEPYNSFKVEKKEYVNNLNADDSDIRDVHRNKKTKKEFNKNGLLKQKNKPIQHSVPEKPVSKSEQKRLESMYEKKKVFKAQEKAIRNALKSVVSITYYDRHCYHLYILQN